MSKQPNQTLRVVEPSVGPETKAPVIAALAPHEAARRKLADAIRTAHARQEEIAETGRKLAHASGVRSDAYGDNDAAQKTLRQIKSLRLLDSGTAWRDHPDVQGAEAMVADSAERMELARDAIAELERRRDDLTDAAGYDGMHIHDAVMAVVQTYGGIHGLVSEAIERERAWKESNQIMDILAGCFGHNAKPREVPGFDGRRKDSFVQPRTQAFKDTIARLYSDPEFPFPL